MNRLKSKLFFLLSCFGLLLISAITASGQTAPSTPPIVDHRQRSTTIRQDIHTDIGGYSRRGRIPRIRYGVTIITQDLKIKSTVRNRPPYVRIPFPSRY